MLTFCSGVKLRRVLSIPGSMLSPLLTRSQLVFRFRLEQNSFAAQSGFAGTEEANDEDERNGFYLNARRLRSGRRR